MSFVSTENDRSLWREIVNSTLFILRSNSLHFYAISFIFLLPVFFTLVVYPSFHLSLFHPHYNFAIFTQFSLSNIEIIALISCNLFVVLFFLCAVATITNSSAEAFHDRPINIFSSIKSIRNSFFPLLSTFIVTHTIFISIIILFALLLMLLSQLIKFQYDSNYFYLLLILVIVPVLLFLQVNWSLAYVIAVVESKYGFETLRRSAYLMKGKLLWTALCTHLFYGFAIGSIVIGTNVVHVLLGAAKGYNWRSFTVILDIVQPTVLTTIAMNQLLVFNVVLYMYCKELKGEKLSFEYVSLPLEDQKKNHNIVQYLSSSKMVNNV